MMATGSGTDNKTLNFEDVNKLNKALTMTGITTYTTLTTPPAARNDANPVTYIRVKHVTSAVSASADAKIRNLREG